MRRIRILFAILASIVVAVGSSQAADWTIYLRSAGPIRIGMPIAEARKALNDPKAYLSYIDREPDNSKCAYLQSASIPDQIGVMFQDGVVARIDVIKPGIRTASGAEVGNTEEAVKRLYPGRISVEGHHYDPEGHYLRYTPVDEADRPYGMVFETDGKKVTSYRTGTAAAIALVEACS